MRLSRGQILGSQATGNFKNFDQERKMVIWVSTVSVIETLTM